jgi:hypothetical protein
MKTNIIYLLTIGLFSLVVACGETANTTEESTDGDSTEEETTVANTEEVGSSDEIRIAELDKWQAFIEINAGELMQVSNQEYTCEGWGGALIFTRDNDKLRALEHVNGGEDGSITKKFYYDETDALVMVWQETSMWSGDNNTTEQITYYVRDGAAFKAMKRKATGTSETIEQNVVAAQLMETAMDGFGELSATVTELAIMPLDQVQDFFCN